LNSHGQSQESRLTVSREKKTEKMGHKDADISLRGYSSAVRMAGGTQAAVSIPHISFLGRHDESLRMYLPPLCNHGLGDEQI